MVLAQDLRDAVLQAALQGKLTKQLETDSSVDGILNSIKEKQIKLIEEKQIRRKKTLPPIKDVPFNIPDNWKLERMQNILNIRSAVRVHQTDWRKSGVSFFRAREIVSLDKDGYVDNDLFIDEELYEKFKKESGVPKKDDLMISGVGTLGNVYIVKENDKFYYKDASVLCFENIGNINAEYIKYALKSPIMLQQIYKDAMGTTVATLTIDRANAMIIPFPPIEEQQRIVDRVNELMEKIDDYEKVEKELIALEQKFPDDMKNALLQAAMQGKLTEQLDSDSSVDEMLDAIKEEKKQLIKEKQIKKDKRLFNTNEIVALFDIPSSWKWTTLGNLVYKLTDGTHKTPKYTESGVKFVSVKDMSTGKLSLNNTKYISQEEHKELYERCNPEKGDILLSKVGTTGVPAIVDTDEQFSLFVSVALLKFNHKYINQKFFYYLIYSPLVQQQATENTKGIGNKNWVLDKIANTLVILPPVEEQQRIVERLEQLLPLCETL